MSSVLDVYDSTIYHLSAETQITKKLFLVTNHIFVGLVSLF